MRRLVINMFTSFYILIAFINYFPRFYSVKQVLESPPALITAALFKIGDHVQTIPDTTPSVYSRQSVAFYGVIEDVIADVGWIYFIKFFHKYRISMLVPEARVFSTPRFIWAVVCWKHVHFSCNKYWQLKREQITVFKHKIFVNYGYARYITTPHSCGCSYIEYYRDSFKCDKLYLPASMFVSRALVFWFYLLLLPQFSAFSYVI